MVWLALLSHLNCLFLDCLYTCFSRVWMALIASCVLPPLSRNVFFAYLLNQTVFPHVCLLRGNYVCVFCVFPLAFIVFGLWWGEMFLCVFLCLFPLWLMVDRETWVCVCVCMCVFSLLSSTWLKFEEIKCVCMCFPSKSPLGHLYEGKKCVCAYASL